MKFRIHLLTWHTIRSATGGRPEVSYRLRCKFDFRTFYYYLLYCLSNCLLEWTMRENLDRLTSRRPQHIVRIIINEWLLYGYCWQVPASTVWMKIVGVEIVIISRLFMRINICVYIMITTKVCWVFYWLINRKKEIKYILKSRVLVIVL